MQRSIHRLDYFKDFEHSKEASTDAVMGGGGRVFGAIDQNFSKEEDNLFAYGAGACPRVAEIRRR
jgi:hypothetical protein